MKIRAAFTLIEMLVYIALLTIMIGGTLLTVSRLLSDLNGMRGKVNTDEEANFMLRKIDWALTGVSAINYPAPGNSGAKLSVDKFGFSSNPICISLAGSALQLSRGDATCIATPTVTPLPLSTSNVTVANLIFQHLTGGGAPDAIKATFTVNGRTYELTKYLRQ